MSNIKRLVAGINRDFTNNEYHADLNWLSSSKLKLLNDDLAGFHDQVILGNHKVLKAPHLDLGSYVHTLALEPHMEHLEYAMFTGWRKAGKDWEAFKADPAHAGKTILSVPQVEQGRLLATALKARPEILALIAGGESELSICSTILDVPVKMRADYINIDKGYILDIKTTHLPAGVENFRMTMKDYNYGLSAALYAQIAYQHTGKLFDFYFAVASKSDRQWDLYKASSETLSLGAADVTKALVTYKKCMASGLWVTPDQQVPAASAVIGTEYIIEAV